MAKASIKQSSSPRQPIPAADMPTFEYLGEDRVQVSLKTATSEKLQFVMTSMTFVAMVRAAQICMNSKLSPLLADIGVM